MSIFIVHQKRSALHLPDVQYVGRPTELGNPYSHLNKKTLAEFYTDTVEDAVALYGFHFYNILMTLPSSRQQFKHLLDVYRKNGILYLSCWCKDELDPRPTDHACHCDILREAILFTVPTLRFVNILHYSLIDINQPQQP
jgi:hypothetical protein